MLAHNFRDRAKSNHARKRFSFYSETLCPENPEGLLGEFCIYSLLQKGFFGRLILAPYLAASHVSCEATRSQELPYRSNVAFELRFLESINPIWHWRDTTSAKSHGSALPIMLHTYSI